MTDTIRAAWEKAAQAMCREAKSCRGDCGDRCAWREPDVSMPACAAAAIATFLQHFSRSAKLHSFTLPDAWGSPFAISIETQRLDALAAAVAAAAKELPHD